MISKTTIEQVFETARVEEVIGDFVQLKKSGSNFKGLSPFSDERTPSFMVSPVKQIWKDFSSGKGGNVVSFLMEHEHFTYPEAIKYLAKKYQIEIEETQQTNEDKEQADERESLYLVTEFAQQYFQNNLFKTDLGKSIGLSYFKERGLTEETIKTFGLGYALDQWDAFTKTALKKGYNIDYLEKTGLSIVKKNDENTTYFDRFKGRVTFPIQSMSGRTLGFGGRILKTDKKAAKYINSPENPIYHKSKVLYGIFHAKQAIAKADNCYLVEGYTDVIQFYQTGIKNVVASSGTALSAEQIRLISRLTKNITVLFDGDAAGTRAALRGIDLILEQGLNVKVCSFPENEDPDSFARKNTESELSNYLDTHSKDFIQFKASILFEDTKNDPIKKAETIRDIVGSIAKIPDRIKREIYLRECSKIMDISESVLFSTLAQINKKYLQEANKQTQKPFEVIKSEQTIEKVDVQYELEQKIIEILLLYGNYTETFEDLILKENEDAELVLEPISHTLKVYEKIYLDLQEDEMEFSNKHFKALYYTIIDKLQQNPEIPPSQFVNTLPTEFSETVTSFLMENERYSLADWGKKNIFPINKTDRIQQMVSETILTLRCYLINKKVTEFQKEISPKDTNKDNTDILQEVKSYNDLKTLLSRKLNRVL